MIGKQILNYEIKSVLGEGGMGTVYLAEHVKLGRQVAIKVLLPHLVKNELVRSRFINEAKLMSSLHHPNIVTLYDYHEDEYGLSLIMELVDGKPLDEYIQEVTGPIQEKEAIILMKQALEGFAYAHKQGLIHRDIKPSNLIVTESKEIKILDFGIAKLVGDLGNKLTKTGSHIGTVYYMSPEQVRGHELDLRSDIYALGITFYQMLTGLCPYDSLTSEFDVFNKIVGEELPDPRTIYPGISEHMCHVIQKATAKKPEDRFQTCAAFIKGLKKDDFVLSTEAKNDVLAPFIPVIENVVEHRHEEATINVEHEIKQNKSNNKRVILFSISGCLILILFFIYFINSSDSIPKENNGKNKINSINDKTDQNQNTNRILETRLKEENEKLKTELENQKISNLQKEKEKQKDIDNQKIIELQNERNKNSITYVNNQVQNSAYGTTRIDKVEVNDYYTILYMTETLFRASSWVAIDPNAYIIDKNNYSHKLLLSTYGIAQVPEKTRSSKDNDVIKFKLYFARISDNCNEIDFIESLSSEWKFYNIKLDR